MNSAAVLAAQAPTAPAATEVVVSVLYYLGLSAAVGVAIMFAYLAPVESAGSVVAARARRLVLPIAVLVAITAVLQFAAAAARSAKVTITHGLEPDVLTAFVHAPPGRGSSVGAGTLALVQMVCYLALVVLLVGLRLRSGRLFGWLALAAAVITAAVPFIPVGSVTFDSLGRDALTGAHVLGALLWIGGLVVLCVVGLMGFADRRDSTGDEARHLADVWSRIWTRFSLVALWAVGMILVSGTWMAWSHVGTPAQLFTTSYGRYLGVKLVLVLALMIAGAYNVRVLLPRIRAEREAGDHASALHLASRHFPGVVLVESLLALGVLVIVPFFRGSARTEAGWATARSFDLTVFGTGVIVVALIAAALWAGTRTSGLPATERLPANRASR